MRIIRHIATLVAALAVALGLALVVAPTPANAAPTHATAAKKEAAKHPCKKHPRSKACKRYRAAHNPKPKAKAAAAHPARGIATHAEYDRLHTGMTRPQVASLFGVDGQVIATSPFEILVSCPDSPQFCSDPTTGGTGVVYAGPSETLRYFTGYANRYDIHPGRECYAIELKYIADALGVYRVRAWENDSNICLTNENRP